MRIIQQNGKTYRAYSPEEFFKSPESTQPFFNLHEPKAKTRDAKTILDEKSQKSS